MKRLLPGAVVGGLGMLALGVALATPASADSSDFGDHYTVPTSGVTCDNWVRRDVGGDHAYWGRCTGDPVGISREYSYREVIKCDFAGDERWLYGSWHNDRHVWSIAPPCPDNAKVIAGSAHVQFHWSTA